mmetsp:Transcript_2017/g.1925  ORF Transcript_2017/g.1925 Transcript_2017/m.1925 type:complete len:131 (-) Transcript_2017:175-567(-)
MLAVIVIVRIPRIVFGLLSLNNPAKINYRRNFFYIRMGSFVIFLLIKIISVIVELAQGSDREEDRIEERSEEDGSAEGKDHPDGMNTTFIRGMKFLVILFLVVMFLVDFYFNLVVREYWRKHIEIESPDE